MTQIPPNSDQFNLLYLIYYLLLQLIAKCLALAQIFFYNKENGLGRILRKMDLVIFSLLCQDHGCQQSHQKIQTQTFFEAIFFDLPKIMPVISSKFQTPMISSIL